MVLGAINYAIKSELVICNGNFTANAYSITISQACGTSNVSVAPRINKPARRGCRVVRWCWVSALGVLQIWIIVGQGPTLLAVGAGGVV